MPRRVENAKIALLDFNLQKHRLQLGVQVLVTSPKELEAIRQREADITKEKIEKILAAGANVILTTKVPQLQPWCALGSYSSRHPLGVH